MTDTLKVICENTGTELYVDWGTRLADISKMISTDCRYPFLAAYVNNAIRELDFRIFEPVSIRFIDITHFEGIRVYERTLFITLHKAVHDLYPNNKFKITQAVSKGFYCEIEGIDIITQQTIDRIKERMNELIAQNIPVVRHKMLREEVLDIYRRLGFDDKISIIESRPHLYITVYTVADMAGYFYGALAPSTGYLYLYDLKRYYDGIYIAIPSRTSPERLEPMVSQDKMFDIFHEYKAWVDVMGVSNIGSLNNNILAGKSSELIKIAEAFHEKKLAAIADSIATANAERDTKLVLISGPSSSGKTTFAKRLGIQLQILGYKPVLISLDDYFLDRDKTPKDENGEYDYETIDALDITTFNRNLNDLFEGKEVDVPRYDFITGKRQMHEHPLKLEDNSIIVVEGIHGLNPRLTEQIDDSRKFKIYISAFTSISMDNLSRIPTTDNRMIRRIVRDNRTRGNDAYATLKRWGSVRRGEDKHIFPYQENADVMFNSSLFYEIPVLKPYVVPLLLQVPETVEEYGEARRMLKFLDNFLEIKPDEIPPTSLLREFIGGSSFEY